MTFREQPRIGVLGLGYVGLPLARAFAAHFSTTGFDPDANRVAKILRDFPDASPSESNRPDGLSVSTNPDYLAESDVFVIAVPTPIHTAHRPDLAYVKDATRVVARLLRPGDTVVYESTVYPGVTEEICVPLLEESGLRLNRDFFVGYSPERINPGDKAHGLGEVVKVTSGSSPEAADYLDRLYGKIVPAGTFKAASIRVAEAAKVIENTQRDLNIALMNELAIIFAKLGIDTADVLAAARTKWNFLPFEPGLVGGHCISVDPYYLTFRAEESGYHPDVILAGRRINDGMGTYVAERVVRLMARLDKPLHSCRVLIMGATFKEDCADLRNTRVREMVAHLREFGIEIEVWEPRGDAEEVRCQLATRVFTQPPQGRYDGLVMAVAHSEFRSMDRSALGALCSEPCVVFDVKSIWPRDWVTERL